jgi:hypothetical protein
MSASTESSEASIILHMFPSTPPPPPKKGKLLLHPHEYNHVIMSTSTTNTWTELGDGLDEWMDGWMERKVEIFHLASIYLNMKQLFQ